MNTLKTLAMGAAAGLSLGACTPSATVDHSTGSELYAPDVATVVVENRNWQDVRVFAVTGGIRHRLGTVTSMGTERYRIPQYLTTAGRDLRILVDPVGGSETFLSPAVQVYAGQEVNLSVQNHLPISSIAVFARH